MAAEYAANGVPENWDLEDIHMTTESRLAQRVGPVAGWAAKPSASAWGRLSIRDGGKGEVMADYLTQRVWVWHGEAPSASRWPLLVRREIDGTKLKFGLSNAKPSASLRRLAEMQ